MPKEYTSSDSYALRVNRDRGENTFPHVSAIMQTYRENDAINKDRLYLGACRRPVLSAVAALYFSARLSTRVKDKWKRERPGIWDGDCRECKGTSWLVPASPHPRRRRRYNIAIMPMRHSWKGTSVEASTVPFSRRN